eukprot:5250948-Prymnesium_polylepis.1
MHARLGVSHPRPRRLLRSRKTNFGCDHGDASVRRRRHPTPALASATPSPDRASTSTAKRALRSWRIESAHALPFA